MQPRTTEVGPTEAGPTEVGTEVGPTEVSAPPACQGMLPTNSTRFGGSGGGGGGTAAAVTDGVVRGMRTTAAVASAVHGNILLSGTREGGSLRCRS